MPQSAASERDCTGCAVVQAGRPSLYRPCEWVVPPCLQAFAILQLELGRPIAEVFSSISERPIAAASLGQVYKAVLRETGEEVAVKVSLHIPNSCFTAAQRGRTSKCLRCTVTASAEQQHLEG